MSIYLDQLQMMVNEVAKVWPTDTDLVGIGETPEQAFQTGRPHGVLDYVLNTDEETTIGGTLVEVEMELQVQIWYPLGGEEHDRGLELASEVKQHFDKVRLQWRDSDRDTWIVDPRIEKLPDTTNRWQRFDVVIPFNFSYDSG